jgi:chromosomal replication initiation ATPase DnaA
MPILDLLEPPVGPALRTRPFSSVKEVKRAVAKRFGVTVADLEGACRKRRYAVPRQVAMALAYRRLKKHGYSTSMIGRCFNRDHTTVLFACRKFGHVPERDPAIRAATVIDLAKWREVAILEEVATCKRASR